MNRRTFLKVLGAGVTVPIATKLFAIPSFLVDQPSYPNAVLVGGYNHELDFYWLRTSIFQDGREWHDLVRVLGLEDDKNQFKVLAHHTNQVMKRRGIRGMITERRVRKAFEKPAGTVARPKL